MSTKARLEREQEFYDNSADHVPLSRRIIGAFSGETYYGIGCESLTWGYVWKTFNLRGKRVLDYGCGSGEMSFKLSRYGAEVDAIDISPRQIELNRARIPTNIRPPNFIAGDAHNTGFSENTFDYVFGSGILHHLDLGKCYREISRVLKPGGRAVFREPIRSPIVNVIRRLTPSARTADETPLSISDIASAARYFSRVEHQEHFLISLAAAPMNLISERLGRACITKLDKFDGVLFNRIPLTRSLAWISMIEMTK